ncbi:hypothetical protein LXL04_001832 [Taraxacum kok-saghyz]
MDQRKSTRIFQRAPRRGGLTRALDYSIPTTPCKGYKTQVHHALPGVEPWTSHRETKLLPNWPDDHLFPLDLRSTKDEMLVQMRTIIKFENGGTNLDRYKSHWLEISYTKLEFIYAWLAPDSTTCALDPSLESAVAVPVPIPEILGVTFRPPTGTS